MLEHNPSRGGRVLRVPTRMRQFTTVQQLQDSLDAIDAGGPMLRIGPLPHHQETLIFGDQTGWISARNLLIVSRWIRASKRRSHHSISGAPG